jgi:hypothetical protein
VPSLQYNQLRILLCNPPPSPVRNRPISLQCSPRRNLLQSPRPNRQHTRRLSLPVYRRLRRPPNQRCSHLPDRLPHRARNHLTVQRVSHLFSLHRDQPAHQLCSPLSSQTARPVHDPLRSPLDNQQHNQPCSRLGDLAVGRHLSPVPDLRLRHRGGHSAGQLQDPRLRRQTALVKPQPSDPQPDPQLRLQRSTQP